MVQNRHRRAERSRLSRDIELRATLSTTAAADDLLLRLADTIEQIKFDISHNLEFPPVGREQDENEEWRARAQRTIERFEMISAQVQRRRELLSRLETKT